VGKPGSKRAKSKTLKTESLDTPVASPVKTALPLEHPTFAMDRVSLSELVRLAIARAEDIALLQGVLAGVLCCRCNDSALHL
jgi:hypothetical protein